MMVEPLTNLPEKTDTTMTDTTDTVLPATTTGTEITAGTGIIEVVTETTAIAGTITVAGIMMTGAGTEIEATGDHATMIDGGAAGARTSTGVDLIMAAAITRSGVEDVEEIDSVVERNLPNEGRPLQQTPFPCPSESERLRDGMSSLLGMSNLPPLKRS